MLSLQSRIPVRRPTARAISAKPVVMETTTQETTAAPSYRLSDRKSSMSRERGRVTGVARRTMLLMSRAAETKVTIPTATSTGEKGRELPSSEGGRGGGETSRHRSEMVPSHIPSLESNKGEKHQKNHAGQGGCGTKRGRLGGAGQFVDLGRVDVKPKRGAEDPLELKGLDGEGQGDQHIGP